MTNYRIEAFYQTGDSAGSGNTSTILSPVWEDLNTVKKALQELKEHHDYYQRDNSSYYRGTLTEEQLNTMATKSWYVKPSRGNMWYFSASLIADSEKPRMVCHIPYHGYFEHLNSLKIIIEQPEENDMEINF
jgi:hypothetical protein